MAEKTTKEILMEHRMEIDRLKEHGVEYKKTIDTLNGNISTLKEVVQKVNYMLESFNKLPERVDMIEAHIDSKKGVNEYLKYVFLVILSVALTNIVNKWQNSNSQPTINYTSRNK